jgi:hypothetical protein
MKILISATKPVVGFGLEIANTDGSVEYIRNKVAKVVESTERLNTYLVVFEDGSKAEIIYWKRLCD